LIGRLNQTEAYGVFPLGVFKPSSSDSADRGHSIIRVTVYQEQFKEQQIRV